MMTTMETINSCPASFSSLGELPDGLRQLIRNIQFLKSQMTPAIARQCVIEANLKPEDLYPWADFDHPVEDSYGRRLVYNESDFEIMVMSWAPGDFSAIHDHGGTQWGAVQSFGEATHYVYQLDKNVLSTLAEMPFEAGTVNAVDHSLIHQMGNPGPSAFLSLHVYGGSHGSGSVTGDARLFDLFEGNIQYTDGGVFFCLPESQITQREIGLRGDQTTTQRHDQQMLARVERMLANTSNQTWLRDRANRLEARINRGS